MHIFPAALFTNFEQAYKITQGNVNGVFLNIRSLRTNFNKLLVTLNIIMNKLDFVFLVETNIEDHENNLYMIDGFTASFLNRKNRRGGGIAVYLNNKNVAEVNFPNTKNFEAIIINMQINKFRINSLVVYRPPALSQMSCFINELNLLIETVESRNNLLIIGDFNINIAKNTSDTSNYLDMMSANGMLNCNSLLATREDINLGSKTNIDHAFVRLKTGKIRTGIVQSQIADHHSLIISFNTFQNTSHLQTEARKKYFIDSSEANKEIANTNWNEMLVERDCNVLYERIRATFEKIYKKCSKENQCLKARKPHPWITRNILEMCKKRDIMYSKWKIKPEDKEKERTYKAFRNQVTKLIFKTKQQYYRNKFVEYRNDSRKT